MTTTIEVSVMIFILVIHFLADFALQTNDQAVMKSSNERQLTMHVLSYSVVWFFASYLVLDDWISSLLFSIITFLSHNSTDFFTSRIGKPYWEKKDLHNGFVIVGADQILHYVQLIFTYLLIIEFNLYKIGCLIIILLFLNGLKMDIWKATGIEKENENE